MIRTQPLGMRHDCLLCHDTHICHNGHHESKGARGRHTKIVCFFGPKVVGLEGLSGVAVFCKKEEEDGLICKLPPFCSGSS